MDPTSYRIPIVFDGRSTSGRKRKQSTSSEEYEFEAEPTDPVEPVEKKARRPQWSDDAKIALLQCRLHLNRIFENNNETVARRAWEKIAAMLDMTCTGDDCIQMFDYLVLKYLRKQMVDFEGVSTDSPEWQQYQALEKLFLISPKLVELYDSVELFSTDEKQESVSEDELDSKPDEAMTVVSLDFSDYSECFNKFCDHLKTRRRKQQLRETKLLKIVKALIRLREENMVVLSEFLKRILFRFNDLDQVAKRESLEALTSICPGIFSVSSVAIATITHYLKSSAIHNEMLAANTTFLMNFTRLITLLVDSPDEEDEFHLKSLPYPLQYFNPNAECPPEALPGPPSLSDFNFKGHLNVSRSTIEELIQLLGYCKSTRSDPLSTTVSVERQMILFMWYLTHNETYEQLALRFSVLSTEVPVILRHFVAMLSEDLVYIIWPEKESSKMEVVKSFESIGPDSFPGVIGAMGTKYLTVTAPAWFINKQGKVCKEEKLEQDIAVQAITDSKCFFTSVHVAWLELPGQISGNLKPTEEMKKISRVHPSEVFYRSPFHIAANKKTKDNPSVNKFALPSDLHVVADSTYPIMESVMVPFSEEDEPQDAPARHLFNKTLHKSRSLIDVAFGKLINRLPRFSSLDPRLQQSVGLILACIAIHNFCMKEDDDFEAEAISLPERPVRRSVRVEEAALIKRNRICQEISSGEINYVYRSLLDVEPAQETAPVIEVDSSSGSSDESSE